MDIWAGHWHFTLLRGGMKSLGLTISPEGRMLPRWARGAPRQFSALRRDWKSRGLCVDCGSSFSVAICESIRTPPTYCDSPGPTQLFILVNSLQLRIA